MSESRVGPEGLEKEAPPEEKQSAEEILIQKLQHDNQRLRAALKDDDPTTDRRHDDELRRLRQHLVSVENEYTEEVLRLENRCRELEERLASAQHQAEQRLGDEERIRALQTQRDAAAHQVSLLEDKLERSATSVRNLQLVVEQIQRENERKLANQRKAFEEQLMEEKKRHLALEKRLAMKEKVQSEQEEALEAAQRLLTLLDEKERHLEDHKSAIKERERQVEALRAQVERMRQTEAEKVDKSVLKGVVVELLSAQHSGQRFKEIQRVLARILDFNEQEMKRTETQLNSRVSVSEKSFYKSFVEFLENESKKPETRVAREPEVVRDLSRSLIESSAKTNPFLVSRSSSSQSLSSQEISNQLLSFMDESANRTSFVVLEQPKDY